MKIAAFVGGIIYDSQKKLINGITECAKENNINLNIFTCGGDIYNSSDHSMGEFQVYSLPELSDYDGIIVAPDTIQNEHIVNEISNWINLSHIRAITIDTRMRGTSRFYVDNKDAVYHMTEHLLRVHHKKNILYISGPKENRESTERRNGFLDCIHKYENTNNITYHVRYGDYWTESGRRIIEDFLKTDIPDCVICANDLMASGVVDILLCHGYRVPDDIAVTGFDNSYESKYNLVRITTVEKPLYTMGYEACKEIADTKEKNIKDKCFPVAYVYSTSCGCKEVICDNKDDIKKCLSKEKYNNRRMSEIINSMSCDLNEVETLDEFISKLKIYVDNMSFPYFYLCMCDNVIRKCEDECDIKNIHENENHDYTDKINVVIAYEDGKFREAGSITKRQLVPYLPTFQEPIITTIMPIHFRLHCFGYCVIGNSNLPFESLQFASWVMNIGNSLENIYKKLIFKNMIGYLNKLSSLDNLTQLYNRAGFYNKANEIIDYCNKNNKKIHLYFIDIDKLKDVNDTYGHEEGDNYIKAVADSCRQCCRDYGIIMRYGGDEFVMLIPDSSEKLKINEQLRYLLQMRQIRDHKPYLLSASVGHFESFINSKCSLEKLINQADKEMYKIKHAK